MKKCSKCKATSGDDWSRCNGKCPFPFSPHYKGDLGPLTPEAIEKLWGTETGIAVYHQKVLEDLKKELGGSPKPPHIGETSGGAPS